MGVAINYNDWALNGSYLVELDSKVEPILPVLQAIGKIPSGIFVMTTGRAGEGGGGAATLVSFVQQISLEPIFIGVALKKGRVMSEALKVGMRFVLNVTAAGDKSLMKKYAKEAIAGAAAFTGIKLKTLESGQTALADACAYVECELVKVVDFGGDHDLYIGKPVGGEVLGEGARKPTVHVRQDGSRY